ncbi:MAG: hypothetical protein WC516_05955 [Patescibacteria group bacterium]|jgi:hypothetical protein
MKFQFLDKVTVVDDFYGKFDGIVKKYRKHAKMQYLIYAVITKAIELGRNETIIVEEWFNEEQLYK